METVPRLSALTPFSNARSLGIQSKLLVMLLTVSVVSVLVAGVIGHVSGTNSLRHNEY